MLDLVKNIQLNKLINKKVLLRVDFNCPIIDGKIMDTSRIDLVFDGLKSISEISSASGEVDLQAGNATGHLV